MVVRFLRVERQRARAAQVGQRKSDSHPVTDYFDPAPGSILIMRVRS